MNGKKEQTRLVLVTGMSGAGKTQAMRALEDMGFFCIDNYPFSMIEDLFNHVLLKDIDSFPKVAIAADVRGKEFLQDVEKSLSHLKKKGLNCSVLYMDAADATLMRRYKETRRKHPLQVDLSVVEAIAEERKILSPIREQADRIVDSSNMKVTEFKTLMYELYGNQEAKMTITVASFGFKYGLPLDSDLVFDVRFLPNPYYDPAMRSLTGKDSIVRSYVVNLDETKTFLEILGSMLDFLIPEYVREGKKQLVISIGCTGGQHRSVAIADSVASSLESEGVEIIVKHRELSKYL